MPFFDQPRRPGRPRGPALGHRGQRRHPPALPGPPSSASARASGRVRRRGVDDQPQVAPGDGQHVAVDGDPADLGMLDRLAVGDVLGDRPLLPELGEARADPQQVLDQRVQRARRPGSGRRRGAGRRPSPPPSARPPRRERTIGDFSPEKWRRRMFSRRSPSSAVASGFIAITSQAASVTRTGTSSRRSRTRWTLGRDPAIDRARAGRRLAGDAEQVRALVLAQPQRAGERREHARRRRARAALLEAGEVVDRQAGELRDLLAAQPGRAAAGRGAQPGVGGAEPVAPGAQAAAELVHPS